MKTVKVSGVHYEMAKENMKKRKKRTIEEYVAELIKRDYTQQQL